MTLVFEDNKTVRWFGKIYSKSEFLVFLKREKQRSIEDWELEILNFSEEWMNEKNESFLVSTSGSTGAPKEISISRKHMIESAKATGAFLHLKEGQSSLLILPAQYIAGKMMIVRALVLGLDFYYLEPKVNILLHIDHKYDFCAAIPLQIQKVLNSTHSGKLDLFEKVIIGGAALSNEDSMKLKDYSTRFYATYGMTETITHIAMKPLNASCASLSYQCLPGVSIDQDERECLRIYSQRLPQEITITNDRVKLINKKEFFLLGRVDAVINSGGLKIQAEELEELIKEKLGLEIMIGAKEDKTLGQKVVLLIEGQAEKFDKQEIQTQLKQTLAKNKVPKEILFIPKLFKTPNQKLNRAKNSDWILKNS